MNTERLQVQLYQRFTSEILWHFCGRQKSHEDAYNTLIAILRTGVLKKGKESEKFIYFDEEKKHRTLYGYPVSCLADIPLKDLLIHAERYGQFAIGFHKESAILNHFHPVLYVNQHSFYFSHYMKMRNEIENEVQSLSPKLAEKIESFFLFLGSVAKSGDLRANPIASTDWDTLQINNFYYEREWRAIHDWEFKEKDVAAILVHDKFIGKLLEDRKTTKLCISEKVPILPISMVHRF